MKSSKFLRISTGAVSLSLILTSLYCSVESLRILQHMRFTM